MTAAGVRCSNMESHTSVITVALSAPGGRLQTNDTVSSRTLAHCAGNTDLPSLAMCLGAGAGRGEQRRTLGGIVVLRILISPASTQTAPGRQRHFRGRGVHSPCLCPSAGSASPYALLDARLRRLAGGGRRRVSVTWGRDELSGLRGKGGSGGCGGGGGGGGVCVWVGLSFRLSLCVCVFA